jgi:hypothetical protein
MRIIIIEMLKDKRQQATVKSRHANSYSVRFFLKPGVVTLDGFADLPASPARHARHHTALDQYGKSAIFLVTEFPAGCDRDFRNRRRSGAIGSRPAPHRAVLGISTGPES